MKKTSVAAASNTSGAAITFDEVIREGFNAPNLEGFEKWKESCGFEEITDELQAAIATVESGDDEIEAIFEELSLKDLGMSGVNCFCRIRSSCFLYPKLGIFFFDFLFLVSLFQSKEKPKIYKYGVINKYILWFSN